MLQTVEWVSEEVIAAYHISSSVVTEYIFLSAFTDFLLHPNCINFHKLQDIPQIIQDQD